MKKRKEADRYFIEKYNTPKRDYIIKTRLTKMEYEEFKKNCIAVSLNHSEYIRQVIFNRRIKLPIQTMKNSEELLTAISELIAEYGKIGSNLNQIARHLNSGGMFYQELAGELRELAADLIVLKCDILKIVGKAYGNNKTY